MELAELISHLTGERGYTIPRSIKLKHNTIIYKFDFEPRMGCGKDYVEGFAHALQSILSERFEVIPEFHLASFGPTNKYDELKNMLNSDFASTHPECLTYRIAIRYEVKNNAELNKIRKVTKAILAKQISKVNTDLFDICFHK